MEPGAQPGTTPPAATPGDPPLGTSPFTAAARTSLRTSLHEPPSDPVCSARGCTHHADFGLLWNNPSLHTPERRKTWLACTEHRDHLSQFLGARGFLREVVEVAQLRA